MNAKRINIFFYFGGLFILGDFLFWVTFYFGTFILGLFILGDFLFWGTFYFGGLLIWGTFDFGALLIVGHFFIFGHF